MRFPKCSAPVCSCIITSTYRYILYFFRTFKKSTAPYKVHNMGPRYIKRLAIFPSPAGMWLIKLSLGWDGKTENPFLQCIALQSFCRAKRPCATRTSHSIQRKSVRASPNHAATLLIYVSLPAHFCHYNLMQRSLKNDQTFHMILSFSVQVLAYCTKTTLFFVVDKNREKTVKNNGISLRVLARKEATWVNTNIKI